MLESVFPFMDERVSLDPKVYLWKLITCRYGHKMSNYLTAASNINKILVSSVHQDWEHSVGIKAAKAKLEKMFHILVMKIFLFIFVHIVLSVEQPDPDS
jgi:hypothetical protein